MKNVTLTLTKNDVQELLHILDRMAEEAVDGDSELAEVYITLSDKIYEQVH